MDLSFYRGKKVLVTGHTGFKGTWLCKILLNLGAEVIGYGLEPPTFPSLFTMTNIGSKMNSIIGDVRNFDELNRVFVEEKPEIVFHLAAQPLVREGYKNPRYTYETNVMGTVNLLECVRRNASVKSVVNVTTDKVYKNNELVWGYRENEQLDGFDPYSNSKSCSELITHCYKNAFLDNIGVAVSTVRAGNVIGGGDFAKDRIIPDCVRAVSMGKRIEVRNPYSIRPYQHVLEPLAVYLNIAMKQYLDNKCSGYYNVGPDECDCISTGNLVDLFCKCWGDGATWESRVEEDAPHEANCLKLDCSLIKSCFGWKPKWRINTCIEKTCEFSKAWMRGDDLSKVMDEQISCFMND